MSDPAFDAAKRAWYMNPKLIRDSEWDHGVNAAQAALAPVRELFKRWEGADPDEHDILDLMKELRPLIYPSEDL